MKNILFVFLLAFSFSVTAQTLTIKEEVVNVDEAGTGDLAFVVYKGDKAIKTFVITIDSDTEAVSTEQKATNFYKRKAEQFVKRYTRKRPNSPFKTIRKKKGKSNNGKGN